MPFSFSLEDFARYRERVGEATYIDLTRRTDPARSPRCWLALRQVLDTYGAPWIVQIWTKDPPGVLAQGADLLRELRDRGTTITAQVTVTGLAGTHWEPLVPPDSAAGIPQFAQALGGIEHISWRYDPIIPTVHQTDTFRSLALKITGYGVRRAVINFIAQPGHYKRVDARLAGCLPGWAEGMPGYDDNWRMKTAQELVEMARQYNLRLACCAESSGLAAQVPGLHHAACGDATWFYELSGREPKLIAGKGSRNGCGCAPYFDVGTYGLWTHCHRCVYCYAG
ncbi:MAG: DUF1848 family protein [Anaerolineae bacterium]